MATNLRLDWCSYEAAKYAVEHWHYSKRMPDPKCVKVGVWEENKFIGAVIFSRGVSATNLSKTLKISSVEIAELSRVALTSHKSPTTKIVSIAIKLLHKHSPKLRLLLSYADDNQGHIGVIYQAGNWIYTGQSARVPLFKDISGKLIHDRACSSTGYKRQFGSQKKVANRKNLIRIEQRPKWRYMLPLDEKMREQVLKLSKPYPKRAPQAETSLRQTSQSGEAGEAPSAALQTP